MWNFPASGLTRLLASFRTFDCGISPPTSTKAQQLQGSRIFGVGYQIVFFQSLKPYSQKIPGIARKGELGANASEEEQAEWL